MSLVSLSTQADIIVSATKLETQKEKVTSDVTIISSEEIENSGATTLKELLQGKSSVYIPQSGGIGSVSSFRLRGLPTGFSKVIIDNIELSDPTDINNSFQVNNLLLENIESIEILKGSQSIIYGSSAVAGVLKINTKKGFKSNSLNIQYGSLNTAKLGLQSSGNYKKLNYGLSASYYSTDGYSAVNEDRLINAEDDSYQDLNLNMNLSYLITDNLEINYQGQYIDSEVEVDEGFSASDRIDNDLNTYEQSNNYLNFNFFTSDDRVTITPSFRVSNIERKYPDDSFTPLYKGRESDARLDTIYKYSNEIKIFSGLQYLKQEDQIESTYSELSSLYSSANIVSGKWFFDLGLRFDQYTSFDLNEIGSLGAGYNINRNLKIKAHISEGFKLPTLYQLSNQLEELYPTESINTELTLSYDTQTSLTEMTLFNYDLINQIDYDTVGSGYRNISKSRIQGIELNQTIELAKRFDINSSVTFQRAKNRKTQQDLARTPRYLANITFGYTINDNQRLTNSWQYVGKRQDSGEMPSYIIGNLNYIYKDISFKILNILDKDYENVRNYGTMPRSYYVSYKLSF